MVLGEWRSIYGLLVSNDFRDRNVNTRTYTRERSPKDARSKGESPIAPVMMAIVSGVSDVLSIAASWAADPMSLITAKMARNIHPELFAKPWRNVTKMAAISAGV
jgi:hypothetical protein